MSDMSSLADLDALRTVIEAVKDFEQEDQKRILRWAAERLGLPSSIEPPASPPTEAHRSTTPQPTASPAISHPPPSAPAKDIKSFVAEKQPRTDIQFAATVAYYFQFEAPLSDRKESINASDLQEACRTASRERLTNPGQTLRNAHQQGLLDKASERGYFFVNTVGENLVAMILPGENTGSGKLKQTAKKKPRPPTKKAVPRKKAARKA